MVDFSGLLDEGFDLLENQLGRSNERRIARINNADDVIRAENERIDDQRDNDRELEGLRRQDRRSQFGLQTTRDDLERNDGLRLFDRQTDRASGERRDDRDLLETRAGVFQDAFESRRGDTLISRALWPLALAVGIGGGVWFASRAIK